MSVKFFTQGILGVSLLDSVNGKFKGMDGGNDCLAIAGMRGCTIMIRMHVGSRVTLQSVMTRLIKCF